MFEQSFLQRLLATHLERARHQRSDCEVEFRGYRNGHAPERKISIGSGTIKLKMPRGSDVYRAGKPLAHIKDHFDCARWRIPSG